MYETVQTAPGGTKEIQDIKHATSRRHSFWFQQWSDTCDTSLAVESALCTAGSPRRWCQRVSRKCYESVGAAKGVITSPLKHQGPWIMMDHHDKSASQLWRTSLDWAAASILLFFAWVRNLKYQYQDCVTMYERVQTAPGGTKHIQDIKHATSRRHSFWLSAMIRHMRYLTGCGISPLHHRFTPKVMSKGVSEMLWKCRGRKRCHHITSETLWTMDHDGSSWQVGKSTLKDFARLNSSLQLAAIDFFAWIHHTYGWRKFRSQTSANLQRWKSKGEKSQRGEVKKWEDKRWRKSEETRCRCTKR